MRVLRVAAGVFVLAVVAAPLGGCHRSGVGGDCNSTSDCAQGLICDPQTRTCQNGGGTDAAPGSDATAGSDATSGSDAMSSSDANMSGSDAAPGADAAPPGTDAGAMCLPEGASCSTAGGAACCAPASCCCPLACGPGTPATCTSGTCPIG